MSRYIDIEAFNDWHDDGYDLYAYYHTLEKAPSIDLDDYVPREFHDKTCEAMAKRHQDEIADMVSVVRCSECKKSHIDGKTTHYLWCTEWGRSTDTFGFCERADRKE